MSTKKVTPCIHYHNPDKQCQILTEFWTNNAMSNCKQITKFKKNLSTLAIVVEGLVRSPPKQKCPLQATAQTKCMFVQISNITKVCVQNALRVLECKLEDVDATV